MNKAITTLSKKKTQLLLLEMDYLFPNNRNNIRMDCNKRSGLVLRAKKVNSSIATYLEMMSLYCYMPK